MSFTVTATQGGTPANGMALTIKVVTGAGAAGTTATSITVLAPELGITPAATGSWVYGAVTEHGATAFSSPANSTFSQNVVDAVNGDAYGTFRSTATTTNGTPVTLGAAAPTNTINLIDIALAEIRAASTLAEDASSPAGVSTTAATTVSTAAFTPPPGSLLVAMVSADATGAGTVTMTVTGGGLAWTALAQANGTNTAYAGVWTAQVPAA